MRRESNSSKQRLRKLCCFRPKSHRVLHSDDPNSASRGSQVSHEAPGSKKRYCGLNNGFTRGGSVDYSYDPVSYALNFEDDDKADHFLMRGFNARLPASPLTSTKDRKGVLLYSSIPTDV